MTEQPAADALFVYGSLQVGAVMEAVTGRPFVGRAARLRGHRRRLLVDRSYPGIVPDLAHVTPGVLFEGLTPDDLVMLDRFEGEPYERRLVEVEVDVAVAGKFAGEIESAVDVESELGVGSATTTGSGSRPALRVAFVYVVRDTFAHWLTDREWDLDTFRAQSLETFLEECHAFRRAALRGGSWVLPR